MKTTLFPARSNAVIALLLLTCTIGSWLLCTKIPDSPDNSITQRESSALTAANPQVRNIMSIQNRHHADMMKIDGVVGTGTGLGQNGKLAIKVFTAKEGVRNIPRSVDGIPVAVEVTGQFIALSDPTVHYARPVPIGVSTGHPAITAGTIGCRVKDDQGNVYALSNNHVFANKNDAAIGDNVLQPGHYDGGQNPADKIGTLADFQIILYDGSYNQIDAAIALTSPAWLGVATLCDDGYGVPSSTTVPAFIGQHVMKHGRTTQLTRGQVSELNVTTTICYECGDAMCWSCKKRATFSGQIAITPGDFCLGGDSGSLIVTDDGKKNPVALLFAGSSSRTLANPIDLVLQRFDVTIDDGGAGSSNPPVANFTYNAPEMTATFSDLSTDANGSVVSWSWTFGDGATSSEANPSHAYSANGAYTATLTVLDNDGVNGSISKTVQIGEPPNVAPTAAFTAFVNGLTVTFTDQSTDSDGQITAWHWEFGDGATSEEQNPIHNYAAIGNYNVKLTVTDDDGATGTITKSVAITQTTINIPPVADFTYSVSGLAVTFTDQSSDSDGTINSWRWNFGDGSTSPATNPIHTYSVGGTYTVTLTVYDNKSATNTTSQEVTVGGTSGNGPTANFSYTTFGFTATFTDMSSDSDGTLIAWSWSFGDGASSPAKNPIHTYAVSGTYTVTLIVTDNSLATGSISKDVVITEPVNIPPVADFSYAISGLAVTFTDHSTDSDGSVIAWQWNFGDGSTSPAKNPIHTYTAGGTYSVTLTVTDNKNATASVSKNVVVSQGGGAISLTAVAMPFYSFMKIDLTWNGANGTMVDIYRNNVLYVSTPNDGSYFDLINKTKPGTYTYKVCEKGTQNCSNEASITF